MSVGVVEVPGPTRTSRWTPMVACAGRCPRRARHLQDIAWNVVGCPSGLGDVLSNTRHLQVIAAWHLQDTTTSADTGSAVPNAHHCRACGALLTETFVDLGATPLANSYLEPDDRDRMEPHYPLHARVCGVCLLVQLPAVQTAEAIFSDYAYFSSYSDSWVEHARRYVEAIVPVLGLGRDSLVVEMASNDGYLLRHLVASGIGGARRRAGRERGRRGRRRGRRHRGRVLRPRLRRRPRPTPRPRRPDRRQQRARPRPRPERLPGRDRGAARARRTGHDRGAAPARPDPRAAVRHDLPRALLVPVAARDARCRRPSRPGGRRRRRAADARRLAPRTTSRTPPRGIAGRARASSACWPTSGAAGMAIPGRLSRVRGGVRRGQDRPARVPDRRAPRRSPRRRLRRAGEGQHAAHVLRRRPGADRVHRRPQPGQAGPPAARLADPDPRPGAAARATARTTS